jgi:crossover junction endodeoxyribonuclease RusA
MVTTGAFAVFVPGTPAPQGSAKAFVVNSKKTGKPRAVVTHDNENTVPWRAIVSVYIREAVGSGIVYPAGPVAVTLRFVMPRRKAEPKRVTPPHTRKPDSDKLTRACLDSMTGLVFTDDAQVTCIDARKRTARIGEQPGVHISWSEDTWPT